LLQPLDVPEARWERVNIDFITKLPRTEEGNDTIITFICPLTKRAHWTACREAQLTAERFAEIFIDVYFRLHGLPQAIISDRDPRFVSEFWQYLTTIWQTRTRMSTAFHPQTDGQAEKANQIVERYLRIFAAGNERRWDRFLGLAEFSYNSQTHAAHRLSPFVADLGHQPRRPIDLLGNVRPDTERHPQALAFADHMSSTLSVLQNCLRQAQAAMTTEANKSRRPHEFQAGDRVWLNSKDLPLSYGAAAPGEEGDGARLSRTLQQRYVGPYTLGKQRGPNAFPLTDLPEHLRISKTRNVGSFKPYEVDESRPQAPPPPVRVTKAGGTEFAVDEIEDWRVNPDDGKPRFQVRWVGYEERTWEPAAHLSRFGARETLEDYLATHPEAAALLPCPRAHRKPPNPAPPGARRRSPRLLAWR
jgi:hypothetical protein